MEKSIFLRPEVLRELKRYVEVRLHIDRPDQVSRDLKSLKEKRLEGDISIPIYEIVDPAGADAIDVFKGADLLTDGARFREFLARNAK